MERRVAEEHDGHGHGHGHGHAHGHAHGHGHGHAEDDRVDPLPSTNQHEPLKRGAGSDQWLFFDAPSGVAGDMTIAALLDLGVPWSVVLENVERLEMGDVTVVRTSVTRGAIGATHFDVSFASGQPERSFVEISRLLRASKLEPAVLALSLRIFQRLAQAESEVHRIPIEKVAFHEVGAVDAIVDIVGAAACLTYVGAKVLCSPLPMGHGTVQCQHGLLPLPAPATVNCLRGVPTYDAAISGELVTPTGAAIVATVAEGFVRWPAFSPIRVGWGAGTKQFKDRPNVLRAVLGAPDRQPPTLGTHTLVEANVDDMTGELAAHALSAMLEAGALDAWATPIVMKKGRPGLTLTALCPRAVAGTLAEVMLRETSTIGVRFSDVSRRELERTVVEVQTAFGPIPVKISGAGSDAAQVKPEFDACAAAARLHQVPVRRVIEAATLAARDSVGTL